MKQTNYSTILQHKEDYLGGSGKWDSKQPVPLWHWPYDWSVHDHLFHDPEDRFSPLYLLFLCDIFLRVLILALMFVSLRGYGTFVFLLEMFVRYQTIRRSYPPTSDTTSPTPTATPQTTFEYIIYTLEYFGSDLFLSEKKDMIVHGTGITSLVLVLVLVNLILTISSSSHDDSVFVREYHLSIYRLHIQYFQDIKDYWTKKIAKVLIIVQFDTSRIICTARLIHNHSIDYSFIFHAHQIWFSV